MIEFPEAAQSEWEIVATASQVEEKLRARLALDTQVEAEMQKLRIRHHAKVLFDAELQAEDTPALEMMTLNDYKSNPVNLGPKDLITGVLNDDGLCLVLGPSRSGKSTLALQMVYCLATGTPWLGQPVSPIAGNVGIMSYDMPGAMMLDWMSGFPSVSGDRFSLVNAHKRGNPLAVPDQRKAIVNLWKARNTEVVVIDSFSASFFGHDQNDAGSVQDHYRELKRFALTEVGARSLIVIVHSTDGSPTKPRGSTVHIDACDSIVATWPINGPGNGPRRVEMLKYREARGQMAMTPIMIGAPDSTTRLVEIDAGEMMLQNLRPPNGATGEEFPELPEGYDAPDTDSDSGYEGDEEL